MSQVPNLSPQDSGSYFGWPSSLKKGYIHFLKRIVLVYICLLCPLSTCISGYVVHNGGFIYFVTFITIIIAVLPLISQSRNNAGVSISPPPPVGRGSAPTGNGNRRRGGKPIPRPREGRAWVKNAFEIRPGLVGAGCVVTEGALTRSAQIQVLRRNTIVFRGNIDSLEQSKKGGSVFEVAKGDGCSVAVRGFSGFEVGDIIATSGKGSGGKKTEGRVGSKGNGNKNPSRAVAIPSHVTVKQLAELLHLPPSEIIKALTKYEIFADVTLLIDYQRAAMVAKDLGYTPSLRKG